MNDAINDHWTLRRRLLYWLAVATFAATLALLFVGASVTSYDVGMAVPDAPTSFEQGLFTADWLSWPLGAMLEHGHRIMGAIVGLLAFLLALALFAADRRLSVRVLGMLMVLTVVGQGLLGRYRVTLNALWGRELAAVHACVAAICLLMMAAIVCATSKRWFAATQVAHDETARLRAGGVALCLLIYVQFIAGAALRHLGTGLAWHLAVAAVSVLLVLWLAVLVLLDPPLRIALAHPATLLLALVIGEVLLGLSAFLANGVNAPGMGTTPTHAAALVASLHQVVGALLLAAALSFALAAFRRLQPVPPATRPLAAAKFVEAAG